MSRLLETNDTRARLIEVGLRLFAWKGYENVSVDELVREAELTKGAFYHHFRSKEHCLAEIHTAFVEYAYDRFARIVSRDSGPEATLRALMGELLDQVHHYRDEVVVLWDARRNVPAELAEPIETRKTGIRRFFAEAVGAGQASGEFHPGHDPHISALGIFGMCMWAYHWYNPDGSLSPQEVAAAFADLVLGGLRGAPGEHPG